ncbi:MAG: DNA repair protein RecN, partial [Chloroflexota bacterium]
SRLMLALKSVFSAADDTPVLVFDEIEVGVGARGGHVIGHKLRALAQHHQVLCITHLAPVAALAGAHFKVRKLATGDRTGTAVDHLDGEARIEELAEMLAGVPIGEPARASARELLAGGQP